MPGIDERAVARAAWSVPHILTLLGLVALLGSGCIDTSRSQAADHETAAPSDAGAAGAATVSGAAGQPAAGASGAGRPSGPASEWNGAPEVFQVNREPAHATLMPFADLDSALAGDRRASPYALYLDGTWKSHWAERLANAPSDFWLPEYDVSDWDDITVPGNWQTQGFGSPIYTNAAYPWGARDPVAPPAAPTEFNAVGSYRRTVTLPDWEGRRVFVSFQGVESAFYLWVNGQYVGYSEDSFTPAEFDVTDHVHSGSNVMAVQVFRWSDGSWLEDQDMIRLSGIFREVFLFSTPEAHIRDFSVVTDLDESCENASLEIRADVRSYGSASGEYEVETRLYDAEGGTVLAPSVATVALSPGQEAQVL